MIQLKQFGSLYPEIFVSEFVKELICSNDLSGTLFKHEVKDYKGREMSKYFCIEISNILPLMSSTAWLIQEDSHRYKDCGDNVIYLRSDCQYERKKLANAQDFNLTYEYIDNFRERKIIVSEKVRKLFQSNKLYVAFTPVAII
ncbi:MAG: hypothetical protein PHD60_02180 [Clostridia bacterium]|nr:hypothetical protein [Clostridia bacterium]